MNAKRVELRPLSGTISQGGAALTLAGAERRAAIGGRWPLRFVLGMSQLLNNCYSAAPAQRVAAPRTSSGINDCYIRDQVRSRKTPEHLRGVAP